MRERRSVLEPRPGVVFADSGKLVPFLNWRSWRTWGVFLGFGLALAATTSIVLLLCAYAIARTVGDTVSPYLTVLPAALGVGWIGYFTSKRAFPLRDAAGKRVPGNPRLELPNSSVLVVFPWMAGFIWISLEVVFWAGDAVSVFAERPPIWVAVVAVVFSTMVLEIPYRVLWRAPV